MSRPDPSELKGVIDLTAGAAADYLAGIADRPVRDPRADDVAATFGGPLPEEGVGAEKALEELIGGLDGAVHSAGPKFFHFVDGGTTPAALGADWLATALDQNPGAWVSSPLAGRLEQVSIDWLKELFGLPACVGRRAHDRRHDGQLRRARVRASLVRRARGHRHRRPRRGRGPADHRARRRLHAPQRRQGARHARRRQGTGAEAVARRRRPGRPHRDGGGAPRAGRRARDRHRQRRRGERGRLRSARRHGGSREALQRLVPRGRRVRAVRRAVAADASTWSRGSSAPTR